MSYLSKVNVLQHGHVILQEVMGSDQTIVQAARTSYGKGTKTVNEDQGLINYLMRHSHTSPFEMGEMKFHIRCPIYVWRQWIRHRTANVNEYSMRYSEAIDDVEIPQADEWRLQDENNKQGSDGMLYNQSKFGEHQALESVYHARRAVSESKIAYTNLIAKGVSREQARTILPLCTYTEAVWKIDVHNLMHFLALRVKSNAQKEIREYTTVMQNMFAEHFPMTFSAWYDYRLKAIKLSNYEIQCIAMRDWEGHQIQNKRERQEFVAKVELLRLGK
jgi:thymidylate synthase (FAD)